MTIMGLSVYQKTTKILAAVECQILVNPVTLHNFLSVLREDSSLVYIADDMLDEYRKLCTLYIVCKCVFLQMTMQVQLYINYGILIKSNSMLVPIGLTMIIKVTGSLHADMCNIYFN